VRTTVIALLGMLAAACATSAAPRDSLDLVATDFVRLALELGERDPGFVDAYYGPPQLAAEAKAAPRDLPALRGGTDSLIARIDALSPAAGMDARRAAFLRGQLVAAATRLRMLQGEKLGFADEAEGLFGVRPELKPLSDYDPVLARIETLVPGEGALADRVDAFQNRFNIPADRVKVVMDAAIAECRRRTLAHIALPANERFTLALVKDKSWSGYNYYQGDAASKIEINTDLPMRIDRAVDLGCHEGYPGHHAYNVLLEEKLAKGRGWTEFTVYPLYSPQSLIAEGSANYGINLAFPGDEQLEYETRVLYPLAGLPPGEARRYRDLMKATRALRGARYTITADYLAGRIDRAEAIRLTQKYQLTSRARAEQALKFADTYRSYVISYGLGQDMVEAYVNAAGPGQAERWKRMEQLLSEPTLPGELALR
jgi:hypothetical protein